MLKRNIYRINWCVYIIVCLIFKTELTEAKVTSTDKIPKPNRVISIKAITGLRYDIVRFKVKPNEKITIRLENDDDMSHNFLITTPGSRTKVVNEALKLNEKGPELDYIPQTEDVLWSIPVISPGQIKSITFNSPSEPGAYPYVCTYPGHGYVMYGVMYVMSEGEMPEMKKDENVPEGQRLVNNSQVAVLSQVADGKPADYPHPYPLEPPYLYRTFLDGASPAAIAVSLQNELSYCWDAGTCRLEFAWKGEFLDNTDIWKGHFDASSKVLGKIFFRNNIDYSLRVGNKAVIPRVDYKGYRIIEQYPEFHYTINGIDVYELIKEEKDGYGLIRQFRIPNIDQPIWFYTNNDDTGVLNYTTSTGKIINNKLKLSPDEARSFTITMTSYNLKYQRKK